MTNVEIPNDEGMPKSEYRSTKQIRNPKPECRKLGELTFRLSPCAVCQWVSVICISGFGFVSDFEFRASCLHRVNCRKIAIGHPGEWDW
jgi:hypothetical protein